MNFYAGIGSRQTPNHVLKFMSSTAQLLAHKGYWLRSGGADGADTAFERGAVFNMKEPNIQIFRPEHCTSEAMELSAKYHPNWDACSEYVHKLHGRNAMIILGTRLDNPVNFVLCWTPEGKGGGGTGQGIRIARNYEIPVIDLGGKDLMKAFTCDELIYGVIP